MRLLRGCKLTKTFCKLVTSISCFWALLQAVNILENVRNSDDKNIQSDSVFLNEPAVHFAKRGLASASDFTSSNSRGRPNGLNLAPIGPHQKNDLVENSNKYIEIIRQRPRKEVDLNYIQKMMSQGGSSSHNFNSDENAGESATQNERLKGYEKSQLRAMVAETANESVKSKMSVMESRRQDLYLEILRKRGQLIEGPDGGSTLVSLAQLPLRMPRTLKIKNFTDWLDREKVWANVTHFPWSLDDDCNSYSIQFGHNLPTVGLVSYPSSGNTWLRYMIEGASGYFTGSMYNDITIAQKGYYGEGILYNSGMTIAVKSHGFTTGNFSLKAVDEKTSNSFRRLHNHMKELNSTAIVLIRNPFKAIIGHRHLDEGGHTGHAKAESFIGKGWDHFVTVKVKSWELFYTDWLTSPRTVTKVVHFENLQDSSTLQWNLLNVIDFLGLETDPGRMDCLLKHEEGYFHRKSKSGSKKSIQDDPYTDEHKEKIRQAIKRVNQALQKAGKESMPLHKYDFY